MSDETFDIEVTESEGSDEFCRDSLMAGETYFHPDIHTFCEEHGFKCVQIDDNGLVWVYPSAGGAVKLQDWKPVPDGTITAIK